MAKNQGSGYDFNKTIGGYKGEPIKGSMLGGTLKSRGFWSNNLPFRQANGLAPFNKYGFLFPTGAEAGAVWRFSQSGEQYQDVGATPVTAVGQAIGMQLDDRINPIPHSIDLIGKIKTYTGSGATTISIGSNTITLVNPALGDDVQFGPGAVEFPVAERGKMEVVYKVEGSTGGNIQVFVGSNTLTTSTDGTYTLADVGTLGRFWVRAGAGLITATKVTVLSITGFPGNHLSQATAPSRPIGAIETIPGWNQSCYSARLDGVDDGWSTQTFIAGTLTANMDFFCAVKRISGRTILASQNPADLGKYFGITESGNVGLTTAGIVGGYTIFVDGIAITNTADALFNALTANTWHVLEYRNLDLSTWLQFTLGLYTAYMLNGNYGDTILCPAQSTTNRNITRTLVGASVGLNI